ncbi:MAG TPA: HAD family hydrolase [Acidimicrobiales bacterium]|jgi:putative hydrolase of the HAD superfamily|nr:HAD family hydrolase [Acidimicrobiales bacterium]
MSTGEAGSSSPESSPAADPAADPVALLEGKALVVFDLDGTLYDDQTYLRPADLAIARHLADAYGRSEEAVAAALDDVLAGTGRDGFLTHLVDRLDLPGPPEPIVAGCLEVLRTARPALALFPWAGPLLRRLAAGGTVLAVLTNGNLEQQTNKVALLGIEAAGYPLTVVYAVQHRQKPAPEGLAHLLQVTGTPAERAVLVGNDPVDRDCARACGVDYLDVADLAAVLAR